jgi:hypothetical protein
MLKRCGPGCGLAAPRLSRVLRDERPAFARGLDVRVGDAAADDPAGVVDFVHGQSYRLGTRADTWPRCPPSALVAAAPCASARSLLERPAGPPARWTGGPQAWPVRTERLDGARRVRHRRAMVVYCVRDLLLGPDGGPLGEFLDVFLRREDAVRFVEDVRSDDMWFGQYFPK